MTLKGKHLTQEDRHYIEDAPNERHSLTDIAKCLRKDPTTISKEVKRNRVSFEKVSHTGRISCKIRKACTRKQICSEYAPKTCTKLIRFPTYAMAARERLAVNRRSIDTAPK